MYVQQKEFKRSTSMTELSNNKYVIIKNKFNLKRTCVLVKYLLKKQKTKKKPPKNCNQFYLGKHKKALNHKDILDNHKFLFIITIIND